MTLLNLDEDMNRANSGIVWRELVPNVEAGLRNTFGATMRRIAAAIPIILVMVLSLCFEVDIPNQGAF